MLHNYLTIAYRNLLKNKAFSFINILGLAIGMGACLLILRYVAFQFSYDRFYPNAQHIYRVPVKYTGTSDPSTVFFFMANSPNVGPALKLYFPQVETYTRLLPLHILMQSPIFSSLNTQGMLCSFREEKVYLADSTFFKVFSLPVLYGDPAKALTDLSSVVITASLAKKYFGRINVLHQLLYLNNAEPLRVSAVMADLPENTHVHFDMLLSSLRLEHKFDINSETGWNWPEFYTYVRLNSKATVSALEAQFPALINKHMGSILAKMHFTATMPLQPLTEIHLHSHYSKEMKVNGSYTMVYFLLLIGILILFIAYVNYINLSTANATKRAREVGIRKVVGAKRRALIWQFIFEAFLLNMLSVLLALTLAQLLWPLFGNIIGYKLSNSMLSFEWWNQKPIALLILTFLLVNPLLAGLYPAFVLSGFKPIQVLKGRLYNGNKGLSLRKALFVFQFVISMVLIAGTHAVYQQLSFMRSQQLGFAKEQLLIVKAPSIRDSTFPTKNESLKREWQQHSQVESVSLSSAVPGKQVAAYSDFVVARKPSNQFNGFNLVGADEDLLHTYGLELVAGRFFSKDHVIDSASFVINEKALTSLGFTSPQAAIGERITSNHGVWKGEIIGVIRNYHQQSLNYDYDPIVYYHVKRGSPNFYSLKVNTTRLSQSLSRLAAPYQKFFPGNPFEYFFLDEYFNHQYRDDHQFGVVFACFSGLAIFIACLGLFGLSVYTTSQRSKEIGIRKILGASVSGIIGLLSTDFIRLILISTLIAWPVAYWMISQWLANYAFHMGVNPGLLLLPTLLVLLIALLTVSVETLKAASVNPVNLLKEE